MIKVQNLIASVLFVLAGSFCALMTTAWMESELDQVRRIRMTIDAEAALSAGTTPEGELTIVKETTSANTISSTNEVTRFIRPSTTRVDTVLSGHNRQDKARADRHSDARRSSRHKSNAWRMGVTA